MEGIVETTRVTVRILGWNNLTVDAAEADVDEPRPSSEKPLDPENEALSWSSIRAAQTICLPTTTQVLVLVRFHLPGLLHTEPKYAVFVKPHLKFTNSIHEIDPDKHFTVFVSNFSTVP